MGSAYQFHSWRVFVLVCAFPSVFAIGALTTQPESPRFFLEVTGLGLGAGKAAGAPVVTHLCGFGLMPLNCLSSSRGPYSVVLYLTLYGVYLWKGSVGEETRGPGQPWAA